MKKKLFFFFVLLMGSSAQAQDFSLYQNDKFHAGNFTLPYRMMLPAGDSSNKYPLLIFLHGAYEKGNDNELQLDIGGRFFMRDTIRKNFPAYILFPQCPVHDLWAYFETKIDSATRLAKDWYFPFNKNPTAVTGALKKLIDSLIQTGKIDSQRIYIGGLSQGGMGVLDMIARYPETFAAAFSICGAGDAATVKLFAGKTALWLFHGGSDEIVPPSFSRRYYRKLSRAKSVVRYSEYPDVGHDSWNNAFAEKDLVSWIFQQHKK